MRVRFPDGRELEGRTYETLADFNTGETFRLPKSGSRSYKSTIWMVTKNKSDHPERRSMIRTVSLASGSVDYKSPSMEVVRVEGEFRILDYGEG